MLVPVHALKLPDSKPSLKRIGDEKVAVTILLLVMVTVVVKPVPEASPDQPVKVEPVSGTAVRVTTVLYA